MRGIVEAVKVILQPERLEELPARHVEPFRVNILARIFGREALERDPEAPAPAGPGFFAWLFGPEELPAAEPGPERGRRSFLGELFGGEDLPQDGPPGEIPRERGGAPPARG